MTDDLEWLAMRLAFLGCDFDAETPPRAERAERPAVPGPDVGDGSSRRS
jgi:hypothetical protein